MEANWTCREHTFYRPLWKMHIWYHIQWKLTKERLEKGATEFQGHLLSPEIKLSFIRKIPGRVPKNMDLET